MKNNAVDKFYQAVDYTLSFSDKYFGTNLKGLYNKYKHVRDYVNRVKPLFVSILQSKRYIKSEDVEKFADLLTAQSALESDWGRSELSRSYNNYSGMTKGTAKNSSGSIKLDGNPLTFETFNSVESWANEYIEYLNRKWKAFNKGPEGFLNQIENNPEHKGQSYSGGNSGEYISKINDILGGIEVSSSGQGSSDVALKAVEASKSGTFYSNSLGKYVSLGYDDYKSKCTSGPATWYRKAGGPELNGLWWDTNDPTTATSTNITQAGFSEVWAGSAEDATNNRMGDLVQPGDIMVEFGRKKDGSPSSHAQMWDGTHWLSDTIQTTDPFVYASGRMGNRSAILYRYGNGGSSQRSSSNKEDETESKSFLEILKDKITQLITSFGTAFSGTVDKVQDVQNSINGVIKKTFITDGAYEGPITKEFLNYSDYLLDNGTLPKGLNFSQWKNKVYDTTGEFPDKLELRGDTKEILSKYEKGKEIQNTNSTKLDEAKVETSNTDTNTVGTGIITDIAKSAIEKNKGPLGEVTSILQSIDNKLGGANDIAMLNAAATGHVVDAVNNGTRSSTNSSRQMISAVTASNQNNIEQSNSLVNDKINTEGVLG